MNFARRASKCRRQCGFSFTELIVVLVIIGILAGFTIPKFAGVNQDARAAAIQGLSGSLRAANALVHGLALARGQAGATGTVSLEGKPIALVNGYPAGSAAGIQQTVLSLDGFTVSFAGGVGTFTTASLPETATCTVTFTEAPDNGAALVTQVISDCS